MFAENTKWARFSNEQITTKSATNIELFRAGWTVSRVTNVSGTLPKGIE